MGQYSLVILGTGVRSNIHESNIRNAMLILKKKLLVIPTAWVINILVPCNIPQAIFG